MKKIPDNQIAFYQSLDGSVNIEVLFAEENIWLTQKKIAGYISCTTFTAAFAAPITIASTTDAIATTTITLISVSNAATYNSSCGAATCDEGWRNSGHACWRRSTDQKYRR